MKDLLLFEKQVGETPLECMNRFCVAHLEYGETKMTYAGRLDPMASGLLLVLCGEKVHEKESFLGMSKMYECTAILGVGTDTYDVLGVVEGVEMAKPFPPEGQIIETLQSFVGTFTQKYPPYSSKTVQGKQLHAWAREGRTGEIEIPSQEVTVLGISDVVVAAVSLRETAADIISKIQKIQGDFRQSEIIASWETLINAHHSSNILTISFKINVSGGTYIRGIVHELGKKLGSQACIWKLHRTQVGPYSLENKDF